MNKTENPKLESLRGLKGAEYKRAWNRLHKDKGLEAVRAWRVRNPEKVKVQLQAMRDKAKASGADKIYDKHYKKTVTCAGWEAAEKRMSRWRDVDDDALVMERLMTDKVLSRKIGRSVSAIWARRAVLTKTAEMKAKAEEPLKPDTLSAVARESRIAVDTVY